jgi:transposase
LHRIGFTYKKTKKIPAKADKEKQEEFIEKYKEIKENL